MIINNYDHLEYDAIIIVQFNVLCSFYILTREWKPKNLICIFADSVYHIDN